MSSLVKDKEEVRPFFFRDAVSFVTVVCFAVVHAGVVVDIAGFVFGAVYSFVVVVIV